MTMEFQFAQNHKLQPVLIPADHAATAKASSYVDLKDLNWATFLVQFGAITGGTATITVEASTASSSNATEAAIPFKYRLSGAVDTDTMGAITSATSAGASVTASDDNKLLIIEVDPTALPGNPGEDYRFLRLVTAQTTDMTAFVAGVVFLGAPRYAGNSIPSVT